MEKKLKDDIYLRDYLSSRVIAQGKCLDNYGKIYYQTTEDLVSLYKHLDFSDQNVLSVLASSDQVFTALYLGSKKIDAFDLNRLTIYYYYLRKWSIKYKNTLYPNVYSRTWMIDLLSKVEPKNSKESHVLKFYLNHIKNNTDLSELFYDTIEQPKGKTIFKSASDLKDLMYHNLKFKNLNLFGNVELDKQYDIVLISNILDWARNDKEKLTSAKSILSSITIPSSKIICSTFFPDSKEQEHRIFADDFELEQYDSKSYIYHKK